MLTAAQLRSRWKTPAGENAAAAAEDVLRGKGDAAGLSTLLAGLPGNEEVVPGLDLRGIELPELISVRADLSGARFDFARMNWNFGPSILRHAVFNGSEGRNVDFGGSNLQGSSFLKAKLPGAMFYGSNLRDADLTGIAMRGGQLRNADCRNARFVGADLRIVWAAEADFRGADLRDANLVGATLGGAQWDLTTQVAGARFGVEGTPGALRIFAIENGASLHSAKPEWEISLLDSTLRALEIHRGDRATAAMMEHLRALRYRVEQDAAFPWAERIRAEVDEQQWRIFQNAVRKAASNIGAMSEN